MIVIFFLLLILLESTAPVITKAITCDTKKLLPIKQLSKLGFNSQCSPLGTNLNDQPSISWQFLLIQSP